MILQKLTKSNFREIVGKKIYCVEASQSYLEEFCDAYKVQNCIERIIDNNESKQGMLQVCGRDIPVCGVGKLLDMTDVSNLHEYAFVITGDYYREDFSWLKENPILVENLEKVYYFANKETEYEEVFRDKYQDTPLENIIIFRSGPHITSYIKGMDFTDNARALFEYMLTKRYNQKYQLVWLVKNPSEYERFRDYENVCFLPLEWSVSDELEERQQYYRVLCLAKYIFFTDAYGIARNCRQDQVRVQLWHGCGYKTRLNFQPCEKRYEYTTVTSDLYAQIHSKVFGLRSEQMLVTGCAKQDWLFQECTGEYRKQLALPDAEKYIYWLPTYRMAADNLAQTNGYEVNPETGFPIVNTVERMQILNDLLSQHQMVLVIKLHPYQSVDKIQKFRFSNIVILDNQKLFAQDIQINQLLSDADALISDYSSVAIDFSLLDRPMAFLLDDVQEYTDSRGFVFNDVRAYLPGAEVYSFEELLKFVKEIALGQDSNSAKRHKLMKVLNRYHDGNSCERILQALDISLDEE